MTETPVVNCSRHYRHPARPGSSFGEEYRCPGAERAVTPIRKTDSKGRISLGVKGQYFTVQSRDDGSFVVTPLPKFPDLVK